jgi:pimeloyl-ACP methyl ester carboxylesterase
MTSSYLFYNDLRVHYLQWAPKNEAIPLVLLHGLASNAHIWDLTAPYLVASGCAPLAPDARGHGLTDKPDGDYDFATFSMDLLAFLEACHLDRPVLVGHSWGANLAMDYAARYPIGPRAPRGLILIDGGMSQLDEPGTTWEEVRDRLTPPRLAGTTLESFIARMRTYNPLWSDKRIQSLILTNFEIYEDPVSGAELIAPRLTFEHHMQIVASMWSFKTYELATRMRCPILAIPARPAQPSSEAEQYYLKRKERGLARLSEHLPGLQVHWMNDSLHDLPLQRPAELADLILNFARQVALPS